MWRAADGLYVMWRALPAQSGYRASVLDVYATLIAKTAVKKLHRRTQILLGEISTQRAQCVRDQVWS